MNSIFNRRRNCNCNNNNNIYPPADDDGTVTFTGYGILKNDELNKQLLIETEDLTVTQASYDTPCNSMFRVYKPTIKCANNCCGNDLNVIGTGYMDLPPIHHEEAHVTGVFTLNNAILISGETIPLECRNGFLPTHNGGFDVWGKTLICYSFEGSSQAGNNEITVIPFINNISDFSVARSCELVNNGKYTSVYNTFYIESCEPVHICFKASSSNNGDITVKNFFVSVTNI